MSFLDILRTAFFALRGNWMRSALTSLGVIIGIAAVIVMVSVGQGTQAEIDKLVSGLGSQRLDISPGAGRGPGGGGVRMSSSSFYTLKEGDVEAIRNEIPEVQYVAGALRGNTQIVFAENNASTSWQGVQADFFDINSWVIANGEGFDAQDYSSAAKVVILGETVRRTLFGEDSGIGQTVRLGRVPFTVVGTLAPKGQGGFGQDQDDVVIVPLEVARRRLSNSQSMPPGAVQQISVGVDDVKNMETAQSEIEGLLRQRHKIQPGADDDFAVRNISQIVATRTATTNLMSKLLGAVAGICLVIGGIGIMNIMLVSVTERTKEIGIRKAMGAKERVILAQFVTEAATTSALGGALGIVLGYIVSMAANRVLPMFTDGMDITVSPSFDSIVVAFGISAGIGVLFGYLPARRAARLNPIEALRYD